MNKPQRPLRPRKPRPDVPDGQAPPKRAGKVGGAREGTRQAPKESDGGSRGERTWTPKKRADSNGGREERGDRRTDFKGRPADGERGGRTEGFQKRKGPGKAQEGRPRREAAAGDRPARPGERPGKTWDKKERGEEGKKFTKRFGEEDKRKSGTDAQRPFVARKSAPAKPAAEALPAPPADAAMTLNKYLAHAGVSSRRDAAGVIKEGKVKVNGEVLLTPGYRVKPGDVVTYEGRKMAPQVKKVYLLLNKPKGFITTTDDEADRRTVMDLVQGAELGRLFPVGRLDRNTTGLLLMTNDGDLAQRLTHPKYEAKKIYQVGLDKPLTAADFEKLTTGVQLEDGPAKPDALAYLETKSDLGLEIHSGRNRIVRRMFESLGYDVVKLDRVMFAGLTKKNVPRGQWRHLTEQEVVRLKHFKAEK